MKTYERTCHICGKKLTYGSYSAFYLAKKNNSCCKSCSGKKNAKRLCDLSSLLDETPQAYYWVGFLMADGHFSNGRVTMCLSEKDLTQVKRFCDFIKWSGLYKPTDKGTIGIAPKHTDVIEKLCEKFDLKHDKTYAPPKTILNHDKELLKYLFIGFIDGDGSITKQHNRNDCMIRIKLHQSWLHVLKEFCELIGYDKEHAKVNKQGYANLYITNSKVVTELKKLTKNILVLDRKWDKIDDSFVSRYLTSATRREKIIKMLNEGVRNKDIAKELNVSESCVSQIKTRYVKRDRL